MRRDEQKLKFQVFSEEKKDFFDKFTAYAAPAVGNQLHRQHNYLVRMNDVAQYPRVEEILAELDEADIAAETARTA